MQSIDILENASSIFVCVPRIIDVKAGTVMTQEKVIIYV